MKKQSFNILVLLMFFGFFAGAQVVDDSTKQNIGFDRTFYFTSDDVYRGDTNLRPLKYENRYDIFRNNFIDTALVQNLGMYGSAGRSYFDSYNTELGDFDGVESYNYLAFKDSDVKYYDTKTPYTYLSYHQGIGGSQSFEGVYNRSYEDIATLGFHMRRFSSPVNHGANPNDDLFLDNTAFMLSGSYRAPSKKYKALVNYRYMKQDTQDNGGLDKEAYPDSLSFDDLILEDFVETFLSGVEVQEKRNEWTVYQEYVPFGSGKFKLFHTLDRIKKVNSYIDNSVSTNIDYYLDSTLTEAIQDSNVYRAITNKVGINGKVGSISYSGYLKNRWWKYEADTNLRDTTSIGEVQERIKRNSNNYVGGTVNFKKDRFKADGLLEIGFDQTSKLSLGTDLKFLQFSFLNLVNRPTLRQDSLTRNQFSWENGFKNVQVRDFQIRPCYKTDSFSVYGLVRLQSYKNYVYYSEDFVPVQDENRKNTIIIAGNVSKTFKSFGFSQYVQYADMGDALYLPTPKLYTHTNINYKLPSLSWLKALKGKVGVDAFYFSSHKPLGYRSDIQQFVVQNETEDGYLKLDAYLNLSYKTVQIAVKGVNLLQSLGGNDGYYPTAGYFGRKRSVELGIKWMFFG